jgi:hypothetical protein
MPTLEFSDADPTQLEAGSTNGALPIGEAAVQQDGDVGLEARGEERINREGNGDEGREKSLDDRDIRSSVNAHERSGERAEMVLEDADEVTGI